MNTNSRSSLANATVLHAGWSLAIFMCIGCLAVAATACLQSITVRIVHVSEEEWSTPLRDDRVYPGDTLPPRASWRQGPQIAVVLSTEESLEEVAKRSSAHHVYYTVSACSADPHRDEICSGFLYPAAGVETVDARGSDEPVVGMLYRLYVPARVSSLQTCSNMAARPNLQGEIERLAKDGMCILVGGGSMAGSGFRSNVLRIQVNEVNDQLVLAK